jgi:mono/diheme cytochrome c family protein
MDHDYDGIRELDNDLPPWWLWLFYITIFWSALYLLHYHVLGTGDSSAAEYMKEIDPNWQPPVEAQSLSLEYRSPFYKTSQDLTPHTRVEIAKAMEREEVIRLAEQGITKEDGISIKDLSFKEVIQVAMRVASADELQKLQTAFPEIWTEFQAGETDTEDAAAEPEKEPEIIIEPLTDQASLASGEAIYIANCATCHGKQGEGGIGPNMTDDYFIHGFTVNEYLSVLKNGVAAKGMIAWRGILKEEQMLEVTSYLFTLRGTNPPNAKAPQGEKVDLSVQ